jgi:hypothetical protein
LAARARKIAPIAVVNVSGEDGICLCGGGAPMQKQQEVAADEPDNTDSGTSM